jgi:hypothetical protein
MRALRFGLAFALTAVAASGGGTAYAGNDGGATVQTALLTREYDRQLDHMLTALISSAEIDSDGNVFFSRAPGDQRFLEADSGFYWQISGEGHEAFASRSLWDRTLTVSGRKAWSEALYYDSDQFPNEPLRVAERTVRLPGSDAEWQFSVARSRDELE